MADSTIDLEFISDLESENISAASPNLVLLQVLRPGTCTFIIIRLDPVLTFCLF